MQLGSAFHLCHYYLFYSTALSVMWIVVHCKLDLTQSFALLQHQYQPDVYKYDQTEPSTLILCPCSLWWLHTEQGYTEPPENWGRNCFPTVSILFPSFHSNTGQISRNVRMPSISHHDLVNHLKWMKSYRLKMSTTADIASRVLGEYMLFYGNNN